MEFDLKVIETQNGGDLVLLGNDLALDETFETMIYLAMFGGNVQASTSPDRLPTEQDASWWGNALLYADTPSLQFNSLTERTLNTTPITSAGLIKMRQAVQSDLEFMKEFAEVVVTVTSPKVDTVNIDILVTKPANLQQQRFVFIWDATLRSLLGSYRPNIHILPTLRGLNSTLANIL